jgi:cell division protein ZapE
VPRGVYIHGGVGRGKSMLMDMLFERVALAEKRRVHFHEFMLEVQRRLHAMREAGGREDPLRVLAGEIAGTSRLLCFDEFHVVNIADAMILGRLFTGLFEEGVVVVATSNWPPSRLYESGLNRDRFVPFIELLERKVDVLTLDGPVDYRLERLRDLAVYVHPLGAEADARLGEIFMALGDGAEPVPEELAVGTRRLHVPLAAKGAAMFEFHDLCERALGAADYLALASRYHTLLLRGVPRLTPDKRNEARRFMTLVDALYERRMVLVVAAEAPPELLYAAGDGAFEFQRTASRLLEMQSRDWLDKCRGRRPGEFAKDFAPFALTSDLI